MEWLKMVYYGLLGITLAFLFINYRHLEQRHRVFIPLLLLGILTQVLAEIIKAQGARYFFLFHIYVPIEYLLLSVYYVMLLQKRTAWAYAIFSNIALVIFTIFYYYIQPRFYNPDYLHFVVAAIFIASWVMFFFYQLFMNDEYVNLFSYRDFWINTGHLFFYPGCLLIMGLYSVLQAQNHSLAEEMLRINHYLNLLLYIFYFIAFSWLTTRRKYCM